MTVHLCDTSYDVKSSNHLSFYQAVIRLKIVLIEMTLFTSAKWLVMFSQSIITDVENTFVSII